jgi:hypothetical protein
MDKIYIDRFLFGLIYSTIIGTIIGELTSSLMIDGYGSLNEEDAERNDDKNGKCYICAMEKPNVFLCSILDGKERGDLQEAHLQTQPMELHLLPLRCRAKGPL